MPRYDDLPSVTQYNNLLYDFYGGLLTKKQQDCYTMRYMDDCSLTEIGEAFDITPQAVVDLLKRAGAQLDKYEQGLGLVKKFQLQQLNAVRISAQLEEITCLFNDIPDLHTRIESVQRLINEMIL